MVQQRQLSGSPAKIRPSNFAFTRDSFHMPTMAAMLRIVQPLFISPSASIVWCCAAESFIERLSSAAAPAAAAPGALGEITAAIPWRKCTAASPLFHASSSTSESTLTPASALEDGISVRMQLPENIIMPVRAVMGGTAVVARQAREKAPQCSVPRRSRVRHISFTCKTIVDHDVS